MANQELKYGDEFNKKKGKANIQSELSDTEDEAEVRLTVIPSQVGLFQCRCFVVVFSQITIH